MKLYRNRYFDFFPEWGFTIKFETYGYFQSYPIILINIIYGKFFIKFEKLMNIFYSMFNNFNLLKVDTAESPEYGFYYYENAFWFKFNKKTKCFEMPWCYEWISTSTLKKDGSWYVVNKKNKTDYYEDKNSDSYIWSEKYPYQYITKYGKKQNAIATIRVRERLWRYKWFKKISLSLVEKKIKDIEIDFSEEIGERTNSWKGGCKGCNYLMLKNETPLDTLKRMEKKEDLINKWKGTQEV